MISKTAIEKAIEGGWSPSFGQAEDYKQGRFAEIALDSTFWQALGKALGWGNEDGIDNRTFWLGEIDFPEVASDGRGFREVWNFRALCFNHLVLTGGDTDKFWSDLLA